MAYLDRHDLPGDATDRMIDGGDCGRERPDRLFDWGHLFGIVENDEHQHFHLTRECENERMFNICQSLGGTPVLFVRFNPDKYKTDLPDQESLPRRYDLLCEVLLAARDRPESLNIPDGALCSVIYLFFDGWNGQVTIQALA